MSGKKSVALPVWARIHAQWYLVTWKGIYMQFTALGAPSVITGSLSTFAYTFLYAPGKHGSMTYKITAQQQTPSLLCSPFQPAPNGDCGWWNGDDRTNMSASLVPADMVAALSTTNTDYPGSCGRCLTIAAPIMHCSISCGCYRADAVSMLLSANNALIVLGPVDVTHSRQCVPEVSTELHDSSCRENITCHAQEVHTYSNISEVAGVRLLFVAHAYCSPIAARLSPLQCSTVVDLQLTACAPEWPSLLIQPFSCRCYELRCVNNVVPGNYSTDTVPRPIPYRIAT